MARRTKRTFSAQFKADTVRLCVDGGRKIADVTKQFDLTESTLCSFVATTSAC